MLMQGNYFGIAPFVVSPLLGAQQAGFDVEYVLGANVAIPNDTSGFAAAVAAAQRADAVIFAGGLDETVEAEGLDRVTVSWPGNQLDLVAQLADVGKSLRLVVAQFGGGQVDDSVLSAEGQSRGEPNLWGGYPGYSGGMAPFDILMGKAAPAGRVPITH